jgi:hypothetical protein
MARDRANVVIYSSDLNYYFIIEFTIIWETYPAVNNITKTNMNIIIFI